MDFKKLISLSALLTTAVSSSFAQCLESSDKPTITYSGVPCSEQPIRVTTKQNYPEGTMFSWKESVTGYMSTESSLTFIPDAAETDYSVTCEVTLPGCTPAKSDPLTIHSGTCCTTADGTPMAMTYLFFDDFGNFVSDDTYEWTDRYGVTHTETIPEGQVHSSQSHLQDIKIPFVRAYNIEQSGAKLKVPVAGSEKNKTELYDQGVYVVSKYGGYPGGVQYDNSGTKTGGMLQFDLLEDGSQDEFFEMEFDHICRGKEISFGVDVASISEHASHIEISLERDGSVFASSSAIVNGETGWKSLRESVVIDGFSESQLKLKMRYKAENPRIEGGDIAIDNLFLSVCTPPDVTLESSVSTGKELYDLCTEDVLKLTAISSDAVKRFYLSNRVAIDPTKKIGYVYQYTFQDPSTANEINKIKWTTIHKEVVIESESFDIEIEKYWDDIFSKMSSDDRIYFRVVVGEYSDLIEDQSWKTTSAFSPCRKVSISSIPVVAGLNCAVCTTPDPVEFSVVGGKFNAANKTVEIKIDETAELGMANVARGIDNEGIDYFDYVVEWFKEDVKSDALVSKKCSSVDNVAPTIIVDYADVEKAGATGVKYIISLHDNFDPVSQVTPCDITDTITVIAKDPTSLYNHSSNTISITPNPASTEINMVAEGVVEKVEILNTVGKVVKISDSKEINIADMHNGVYFVRTTIDGETSVHRLVVNK